MYRVWVFLRGNATNVGTQCGHLTATATAFATLDRRDVATQMDMPTLLHDMFCLIVAHDPTTRHPQCQQCEPNHGSLGFSKGCDTRCLAKLCAFSSIDAICYLWTAWLWTTQRSGGGRASDHFEPCSCSCSCCFFRSCSCSCSCTRETGQLLQNRTQNPREYFVHDEIDRQTNKQTRHCFFCFNHDKTIEIKMLGSQTNTLFQ